MTDDIDLIEEATAFQQLLGEEVPVDQPTIDAAFAMRGAAIRRRHREGATVMELASAFKLPPLEIRLALEKRQ